MLSKKEAKDIQSLRHKKFREETGLFTAEGPKIVSELVQLIPERFEKIYAVKDWLQQHPVEGIKYEEIDERTLEKISQLQTPNEVIAVLRQFKPEVPSASDQLCLYLDTIQDPGNLGTIIRIADWFGIKDIICSEGCADRYNPKVVQSTMASIARVNVYYDHDLQWLKNEQAPKYAAALNGTSLYDCGKAGNGVLIIGNESKGISPEAMQLATQKITIPRRGEAESLNAAVATGIILSHLVG
ncbi:RNA methyltransferase [Chitinophagaceae bacterium LB-8]|uniref:RNA methyltransferase n=1 Tax=Paraflavisolibacter caeni TaxID=2982496 RepID=A0A9X3BGU2_9BACT|nr:RNA methyltransferase [Paraflavisolibacter caeni]MCU7548123.1 RNA methyltransferase [Paraflavisolibacter caeni]